MTSGGAQPGTDSRKFLLRAERGMVYTVTYSATDGSGNKSTASATVTVPHDQDERARPGDEDNVRPVRDRDR